MKLSEAIRDGARLHPQTTRYFRDDNSTCALGAAYVAISGSLPPMHTDPETNEWEVNNGLVSNVLHANFPFLRDNDYELWGDITERNDKEGQTREQIAEWLESIGY